jgi:hypothetical protein
VIAHAIVLTAQMREPQREAQLRREFLRIGRRARRRLTRQDKPAPWRGLLAPPGRD